MKLYRHWARGSEPIGGDPSRTVHRYAGSNRSFADARDRAMERARAAAKALVANEPFERYAYSDRPMREEILDTSDDQGESWAITRNAYGCLVLNTARVFFADIDDPPPQGGFGRRLLDRLLGRKPDTEALSIGVRNRVQSTLEGHGLGGRLYRTAAGHRLLVTTREFEPEADDALELLRELGSDQLYISLCKAQSCFRARVSPKPWRCGAPKPPSRFPWSDLVEERKYRDWERAYNQTADRYATCKLVATIGAPPIDSIAPIVERHDRLTRSADSASRTLA